VNPSEAATVLAVAVTLDNRLKPPSREDAQARATAWSETLDSDLTPSVAQKIVIDHYRETTDSLMPAHVNRAWRSLRKQQKQFASEEAQRKAAAAAAAAAVPMPRDVKVLLEKSFKETDKL